MKITKKDLIKQFKILDCIINYKNSDYTPTFFKSSLQTYEDYFYIFSVKLVAEVNDDFIYKVNALKQIFREMTLIDNNLEYELFLESSSDIEITENVLNVVEFSCKGKIYKPRVTKTLKNGEKITLNNFKDVKLNILKEKEGTSQEVTCTINKMKLKYNSLTGFKIDSENGTVSDLIDWDFYEFPKTKNKEFIAKLNGIDSIIVSYREEL